MENGITQLPDADRIEGISLVRGLSPQASHLKLQYRNAHTGLCEVQMPLLDAMYLLNLLEALSKENGLEILRKGPANPKG